MASRRPPRWRLSSIWVRRMPFRPRVGRDGSGPGPTGPRPVRFVPFPERKCRFRPNLTRRSRTLTPVSEPGSEGQVWEFWFTFRSCPISTPRLGNVSRTAFSGVKRQLGKTAPKVSCLNGPQPGKAQGQTGISPWDSAVTHTAVGEPWDPPPERGWRPLLTGRSSGEDPRCTCGRQDSQEAGLRGPEEEVVIVIMRRRRRTRPRPTTLGSDFTREKRDRDAP